MITARIKWGKESVDVDVDLSASVAEFRAAIERKTGVPAARQKLNSAKGPVKDDTDLRTLGIESGKPLMLIGTAEAPPQRPTEPIVFAEDNPAGHASHEPESNGLVNLGNTCYLNSVIQVLRLVPELRPRLAQSTNSVAKALGSLYTQLDSTRTAVQPLLFWTSFMSGFPAFSRTDDRGFPMQHDSQEALTSILEAAGQLQAAEGEKLFGGRIADASGEENFTMLSCSITADVQLLETGIERSLIDTNGVSRKISALPPYILVHMIRFAWRADTKENAKVLRPVAFPMVLDLQPFCTDALKAELEPYRSVAMARRDAEFARRKREKMKSGHDDAQANEPVLPDGPDGISGFYELAGVISHKGRTLDGGHYVAWTKKRDVWLLHDDDHVGAVTAEEISRLRGVGEAHIAYVLLYRCRNEAGHAPYVS